jgi:hypothetical protein
MMPKVAEEKRAMSSERNAREKRIQMGFDVDRGLSLLRFGFGMALLEAWVSLLYSSKVLLLPPADFLPLSIVHLFSTLAVAATSLVLALVSPRVSPLSYHRRALYVLGCVGSLATLGIVLASTGVLASPWIVAGVILTALSGTCLSIAWIENFITQGARGALICYVVAVIGGSVLSLLIALLPLSAGIVCAVLLPVLAVICLRPRNLSSAKEQTAFAPPAARDLWGGGGSLRLRALPLLDC